MPTRKGDFTAAADRLGGMLTKVGISTLLLTIGMYALFREGGLTVALFHFQDLPILLLGSAFLLALGLRPFAMRDWRPKRPAALVLALALAVLLVTGAGTWLVFGDFPLTRDEILADFDAYFLARGLLIAPVPLEWRPFAPALMPQFMLPIPTGMGWLSAYLPGNAALRALGELTVGAEWTNPILAAISVVAVYRIGRRLWPDSDAALMAALLLATSVQVLAMAMTAYAMSAHLAFNLLWLWAFLRDDKKGDVVALLVGFVATGLHQLIFHPLFVTPFILQLWLAKRWRRALVYTVGYGAICLFWICYWQILLAGSGVPAEQAAANGLAYLWSRLMGLLAAVDASAFTTTLFNLLRFLSWQNVVLLPFALLGWPAMRRDEGIARPLAAGILLTLIAMLILLPWQGLGWGYRYVHGLVGNLCLLAGYGWYAVSREGRRRSFVLAAGTLASLLVVVPLHLKQVHDLVAPTRRAFAIVSRAPVDIVIIAPVGDRFDDLVRNLPDLSNRPKVMNGDRLNEAAVRYLCSRYRVHVFDFQHGAAAGFPSGAPEDQMAAHQAALRRMRCATRIP